MINKRPVKVIIISILGLLISSLNLVAASGNKGSLIFIIIAAIYAFLSIGIFLLLNWIRIITIIFSLFELIVYIQLLYFGIKGMSIGGKNAFLAMGIIFNFPNFVFSLLVLDTLTRRKIKELFIKK